MALVRGGGGGGGGKVTALTLLLTFILKQTPPKVLTFPNIYLEAVWYKKSLFTGLFCFHDIKFLTATFFRNFNLFIRKKLSLSS